MAISEFKERATVIERLRLSMKKKDPSQRLSVAEIVDQNLSLGAKNPRDQVYALLSLSSDATVQDLEPNYDPEVSNKNIFTKISWYYLQDGNRLNLFLSAGLAPRVIAEEETPRTPGLQSWVYDFAYGPARDLTLSNWATDLERSKTTRLNCKLSPKFLSVNGTVIDKVAFFASQLVQPSDVRGFLNSGIAMKYHITVRTMVSLIEETRGMAEKYVRKLYPGDIEREEAYWRTIFMGSSCSGTSPLEAKDFFVILNCMARDLRADPTTTESIYGLQGALSLAKLHPEWSYERVSSRINSLMETFTRVWKPYTFVVLESGYMGWAPPGVQAGDVFCLFDGCIVPFVLRPTEGANTYSLWGDGYVHGFMPGQQPGIEGKPTEWFKIV